MNPDREGLAMMRKENLRYPKELVEVPKEEWTIKSLASDDPDQLIKLFRSRDFLVQVFRQQRCGDVIRISVQRTEWDMKKRRFRDDISWDDLQRLKAEAGFGNRCAVEVFPPDDRIVNVANMRHLFLLQTTPAFVWDERT